MSRPHSVSPTPPHMNRVLAWRVPPLPPTAREAGAQRPTCTQSGWSTRGRPSAGPDPKNAPWRVTGPSGLSCPLARPGPLPRGRGGHMAARQSPSSGVLATREPRGAWPLAGVFWVVESRPRRVDSQVRTRLSAGPPAPAGRRPGASPRGGISLFVRWSLVIYLVFPKRSLGGDFNIVKFVEMLSKKCTNPAGLHWLKGNIFY